MTDVVAIRNEFREQTWTTIIQECNASGLSNKEFCGQRGISLASYYYWLRKLRTKAVETAVPKLVPLSEPPVVDAGDLLEIRYRGADLRLPGTVDLNVVTMLLRSLQRL